VREREGGMERSSAESLCGKVQALDVELGKLELQCCTVGAAVAKGQQEAEPGAECNSLNGTLQQ
jgi:hypothetical protein